MTDNIATLSGYTKEIHGYSDQCELFLLVKPDTDLDDSFKAWDMDEQEFIRVHGWLFLFEDMDHLRETSDWE